VEILSTHEWNEKLRQIETIARMGGGQIRNNDGRGESNYVIL
jgi:hypothetical protein